MLYRQQDYTIIQYNPKINIKIRGKHKYMSAENFNPREPNPKLSKMFSPWYLPTFDRYFSLFFLKMFISCIILVLGLVLLIDILENFDEFYKYANNNNKSTFDMFWILTKHYAAYAPSLVIQHMFSALPVAAAVIAITKASLNKELTVLRASGVALQRTVLPLIVVALVISSVFALTRDMYVPTFLRRSFVMNNKLRPAEIIPLKLVMDDGDNIQFIEMGHYDGDSGQAYNLRIEVRKKADFFEGKNIFVAYRAKRASLQPYIDINNPDDPHINKWTPEDSASILVQMNNNRIIKEWDESLPSLVTQAMLERQVLTEKVMTWDDLMRLYSDLEVQLEIHNRLSQPFLPVAMLLVTLALILKTTSAGQNPSYITNAILGVICCAVFFMLRSIFFSLGESGFFPPLLAAQGASIIYFIVGGLLLCKVEN